MSHLATFSEYYDYWEATATNHVDITGFKFGDKGVIRCAARSDMSQCELWVENYEPAGILDPLSDNHHDNLESSLVVFKPKPESWVDQRTVYEECENIVKDIIAKMLWEHQQGHLQIRLSQGRFGEANMKAGASELLGCRFDFMILRPSRLVYNVAKWI